MQTYRIHKGAVEGGNVVSTLKFSVIGVQFRLEAKRESFVFLSLVTPPAKRVPLFP
jgi:hypothetical protein